jgi:aryl-alcohol dehydrogenase-like predicted oxidoreductase
MEYRNLGKSGLKVSEVGLGAQPFGGKVDEPTAISIIEKALEMGINFIDTAEQYSEGRSEEIIGKALKGKRSEVVIASKFGHVATVGPRESRGSRNYITKAVEGNLRRLNTDYLDLYSLHYPDPGTPIEETLRAMDDLVHAGKVRYIGCSNFAAWQICEGCWTSKSLNLASFIAIELEYNLLKRDIEAEAVPCCQEYGVGIIPWGPLAGGFLTGKYHRDKKDEIERFLKMYRVIYRDSISDANFDKLARWVAFAEARGHSMGELAIAWLISRPWVGSVIPSATSLEQLSHNVGASDWKLTAEDIVELDKI